MTEGGPGPRMYPLTEEGLAEAERDLRAALRPVPDPEVPDGQPGALTWEWLVRAEPLLETLRSQAKRAAWEELGREARFCANRIWYGYRRDDPAGKGLKGLLSVLVGWERRRAPGVTGPDSQVESVLRSERAYDLAYHAVYEALPDCRHEEGACG